MTVLSSQTGKGGHYVGGVGLEDEHLLVKILMFINCFSGRKQKSCLLTCLENVKVQQKRVESAFRNHNEPLKRSIYLDEFVYNSFHQPLEVNF